LTCRNNILGLGLATTPLAAASDLSKRTAGIAASALGYLACSPQNAKKNSTSETSGGKADRAFHPGAACSSPTRSTISPGRTASVPSESVVPGTIASIRRAPSSPSKPRTMDPAGGTERREGRRLRGRKRRVGRELEHGRPAIRELADEPNTHEVLPFETQRTASKLHRCSRRTTRAGNSSHHSTALGPKRPTKRRRASASTSSTFAGYHLLAPIIPPWNVNPSAGLEAWTAS
jgi:hypothetical protein